MPMVKDKKFPYTAKGKKDANLGAMHDAAMEAWKEGVKTLYYMRTESVLRGDIAARAMDPDCVSCEG